LIEYKRLINDEKIVYVDDVTHEVFVQDILYRVEFNLFWMHDVFLELKDKGEVEESVFGEGVSESLSPT
jgi:hypothetical protein